ncbi:hydroperoxide isomerase ALOXE3-like [Pituophis catenifer annectens]|uniref:hydroperoxide isomerase ALOXE3-like n=1 Tax=Pituophis catenifer annectens TaxID=94852 RepID=UPI0039965C5F
MATVPSATYKIRVATGNYLFGGTMDTISISLVGAHGETPKFRLDKFGKDFSPGEVEEFVVETQVELGDLLLVRLHKEPYGFFPPTNWNCSFIEVETPEGQTHHFPCYQWIPGYPTFELREGTATLAQVDANSRLLSEHRRYELLAKQETYRYKDYQPGWPKCLDADSVDQLHLSDQYSSIKSCSFRVLLKTAEIELKLKGLLNLKGSWKKLADIRRAFWFYRTPTSEYVSKHWAEDAFFGYQYLNGASPGIIQRCSEIPAKFPVTQEMVVESLGLETTLEKEVKEGRIFLLDCQILEGIPATTLNGSPQYVSAPLCLLHLNPWGEMMPVAIQLTQQPGPRSPIFLPTDPEWDWALAKFWVRNSTLYLHEILAHLLHTHLLVEVYLLATLRQLPKCHPVHKLLIPHFRYTLHINILGRTHLLAPDGMLDKMIGTGFQGLSQLVARGLSKLTYSMLCLPDDLRDRGVDALPNYHYKEDGLKLWSAIESFVSGMIGLYYPSDGAVEKDMELQAWVAEIFEKCFHQRQSSGFPAHLGTIAELTKYLTMMIFTCSARHASVNNSQFDFGAWMPNYPSTMRRPPPESKGGVTFANILETLPDVSTSCQTLLILWLLSRERGDKRSLGYYPEEHFTEEGPKNVIAAFQKHLAKISQEIQERNRRLPLPYNYLNPPEVENSISI